MKKLIFGLVASVLFAASSLAAPLTVATGSKSGTYSTMFKEMGQVCQNTSFLKERGTSGSLENIDLLLTNKASLAFVQLDVLKAKEKIDKDPNVKNVKVLMKLHNEEVHIITTTKPQGNVFKKINILTYADLAGKDVGAIGGAFVTAKVLSSYTGVQYNVTSYPTSELALQALTAGKVSAIFFVGGYPLPWVSSLPNRFKLVSFESNMGAKVSSLFTTGVKVSYPNLGGSFTTVSIPSVLATRDFKTADKRKQLLAYASCVKSNLTRLQETEGYHPKWSNVTKDAVDWPLYK